MIVSIREIPVDERHLLFCSKITDPGTKRRPGRPLLHFAAMNRSLAIHDESIAAEEMNGGFGENPRSLEPAEAA